MYTHRQCTGTHAGAHTNTPTHVYTGLHVCTHAYTQIHACAQVRTHADTCTQMHVCADIYARSHRCTDTGTQIHIYAHIYVHAHVYTCTHRCTHKHTDTHAHRCTCVTHNMYTQTRACAHRDAQTHKHTQAHSTGSEPSPLTPRNEHGIKGQLSGLSSKHDSPKMWANEPAQPSCPEPDIPGAGTCPETPEPPPSVKGEGTGGHEADRLPAAGEQPSGQEPGVATRTLLQGGRARGFLADGPSCSTPLPLLPDVPATPDTSPLWTAAATPTETVRPKRTRFCRLRPVFPIAGNLFHVAWP